MSELTSAGRKVLAQARWMAGLEPDRDGEYATEPLSVDEVRTNARSARPYAWAFKYILANDLADKE